MQTWFITLLVTLVMVNSVWAQSRDGWKLVWQDEFDTPGAPDPDKWDYEEGFLRNEELQFYTRDRRENVRVEDGSLVLEGRKEAWPNTLKDPKHWYGPTRDRDAAEYTSGSVRTKGKADFTYGRIEVRAKLPLQKGVWPAAWMLGANIDQVGWAKCGEIDIMEFVGKEPQTVHSTVHYHTDIKRQQGRAQKTDAKLDEFNVYAVEWSPDRMDFYFNDLKHFSFDLSKADLPDGSNPFRKPQYLILNLALGGAWGGEMDPAVDTARYEIDYVRVYEQVPPPAAADPRPTPAAAPPTP